jgi:hypothetical protein
MLLVGCLPADNRPVPASILVTAEPSDATKSGFVTDDGWEVKFDRVLLALGDVDLDEDAEDSGSCASYSETHYEKLFDFVHVDREKVGLVHGLGDCSLEYRVRGPSDDTLLGSGATDADVSAMDLDGSDQIADSERVTLRVQGAFSKDGVSKRFDWSFRRSFEVSNCKAEDGTSLSILPLEGESEHTIRIEVRPEELFRIAPDDDAPFEALSLTQVDDDEDGEVTFSEMSVLAAMGVLDDWAVEGIAEEDLPDPVPITRLETMYEYSLPRITRIAGGAACEAEVRGRR